MKERIDGGSSKPSTPPSPSPKVDLNQQTSLPGKFPFVSQDKGVTIEVTGVRQQTDFVVYDVALQNESTQPVKFLYSFLNISDDQGRALSADTTGLPTDLPIGSQKFTGTVSISTALLDKAKKNLRPIDRLPRPKAATQAGEYPSQMRNEGKL